VQRGYVNAIFLRILWRAPVNEVQEVVAIRQKVGPTVGLSTALAGNARDRRLYTAPV
jgi:hypothetical protein